MFHFSYNFRQVTAPITTSTEKTDAGSGVQLSQTLGLFSATAIVAGSMIGSGIFLVAAEIARITQSAGLFLAAWAVTAVMTIIGALCYGELAAMMPAAGGQYVYLREALGPLWGFLYGWTLFLVIQTGTIAAVCVGFGKFLGVFFPMISSEHWLWHIAHVPVVRMGPVALGNMEIGVNTANLAGLALVILLAVVNVFGVRLGALVQNIFTTAKALSLAAMVALGLTVGRHAQAIEANFQGGLSGLWQGVGWTHLHSLTTGTGGTTMVSAVVVLAVVQVGSLFSADAWNNVTFTAGEVKNPQRNLPLSLLLGTGSVLTIYFLISLAYLLVLPLKGDPHGATVMARGIQFATDDRVGTAVLEAIFPGLGTGLMAAAILISGFGCANGMTLAGARVYYAMSKDGLFFKAAGRLHPRYRTPVAALAVQAAWTVLLCVSGSFGQLLDYVIFAVLVFYILTIAGLVVLRIKRPDAPRPYRALGYPFLPLIYIVMASWICVVLLRYKPQYTWPGLGIVLLGIPVYFLWTYGQRRTPESRCTT